jgi:antitoxin (DNA-binding transcriptional repressor) of toxin-antitoxin stability system
MTVTIDVREAETTLRRILDLVHSGTEVVLTEDNQAVARILAPLPAAVGQRVAGLHAGAIETAEDFDEPLPDEFWAGGS